MRPTIRPSGSDTAHPRPLTGSPSSKPGQVKSMAPFPSMTAERQSRLPWTAMKPKFPCRPFSNSMNAGQRRHDRHKPSEMHDPNPVGQLVMRSLLVGLILNDERPDPGFIGAGAKIHEEDAPAYS